MRDRSVPYSSHKFAEVQRKIEWVVFHFHPSEALFKNQLCQLWSDSLWVCEILSILSLMSGVLE